MTDCEKYSNSVIKPLVPMKKRLEYIWVNPIPSSRNRLGDSVLRER